MCELGAQELHDLHKGSYICLMHAAMLFIRITRVYVVCPGLEITLSRLDICNLIKVRSCKGLLR